MLALNRLRSVSVIFSETSVEVPTLSWDVLMESSPAEMPPLGTRGRQIEVGDGWGVQGWGLHGHMEKVPRVRDGWSSQEMPSRSCAGLPQGPLGDVVGSW